MKNEKDEIIYWFITGLNSFCNLDIDTISGMCYVEDIKEKLPSQFKDHLREVLIKGVNNLECCGESFTLSPDGIVSYKFFKNKVSYIKERLEYNINKATKSLDIFNHKVDQFLSTQPIIKKEPEPTVKTFKVTNVKWDTKGKKVNLPSRFKINLKVSPNSNIYDMLASKISDICGYTIKSFHYKGCYVNTEK